MSVVLARVSSAGRVKGSDEGTEMRAVADISRGGEGRVVGRLL